MNVYTGCGINLSESWMLASCLAGINKIEYNPDAGAGDNLCFKHYDAHEVSRTAAGFLDTSLYRSNAHQLALFYLINTESYLKVFT